MSDGATSIDPATLQVWISRLTGVADEMGAVLRRAAFSPNIKERADCSAALFTPTASCSCRPSTSRCTSARCRPRCAPPSTRSASVAPGDQVIVNDPFAGGTHLNDITFVAPCFVDDGASCSVGRPTARITPTSGGWRPARCRPTRRRSSRKGLRIPPVRWPRRRCEALFANSRTPDERGRRPRRAGRGQRRRGRGGCARDRRRAPAGRGRRLRRAPDAAAFEATPRRRLGSTDVLDSTGGPSPGAADLASRSRSTADRSRSTSPAPTRSGSAT